MKTAVAMATVLNENLFFVMESKELIQSCFHANRLLIGVVSQPFCVDQLNPAGFNVSLCLIRKIPAFFLRGKLEI